MAYTHRIGYLDIAKSLAVALIIIGHIGLVFDMSITQGGVPSAITRFAFSVHLPIFFIVSGYFLKPNQEFSIAYVVKSARQLLSPYVAASALIVMGWMAITFFRFGFVQALDVGSEWLMSALWGACAGSEVSLIQVYRIGGIWFLLALFWARLLIAATNRLPDLAQFIISAAFLTVSVYSAKFVWLPFSVQSGLGCMFYVLVGRICREYRVFETLPWYGLLGLASVWLFYLLNDGGRASLGMSVYPLGALDVAAGIAGAICIIRLCKFVESCFGPLSWLELAGRNTLVIFALHIVEDDLIPWGTVCVEAAKAMNGVPYTWIVVLMARVLVIMVLVGIAYVIPTLRCVFFPHSIISSKDILDSACEWVGSVRMLSASDDEVLATQPATNCNVVDQTLRKCSHA